MTTFRATMALSVMISLIHPGASAAAAPDRAASLTTLSDCRKVANDTQRLACYDDAAAAIDAAEAKGEIVVVDRDQARQVRRQAFGFALPSLSILERSGGNEPVDEITAKVVSARQGGDGKWVVVLEGGQTWRQIDTGELGRYPKAGGMVTIKRALMGSYKLSAGGAAAIRVHRDD